MQSSAAQENTLVALVQRNSHFSLETECSVGSSNLLDQQGSPTNVSEVAHQVPAVHLVPAVLAVHLTHQVHQVHLNRFS